MSVAPLSDTMGTMAMAMAAADAAPPQEREYLAKDYASFRALMLGRLAALLPGGIPSDPASVEVALVEALAYVGDYLSYYQDAVATEAYLDTARRRVSVARHARLLDYRLDEGCAARVLVQLETRAEAWMLPAGAHFLTRIAGIDAVTVSADHLAEDRDVFASLHAVAMRRAHNRIALAGARLGAGATAIRLAGAYPHLAPGDLLFLSHDRGWAHPVRLTAAAVSGDTTTVRWHDGDALPAAMAQAAPDDGWTILGNVVLAQQGLATRLATVDASREHRLACAATIFAMPYHHTEASGSAAAEVLVQPPDATEPMLDLIEELPPALAQRAPRYAARRPRWQGRRSLVASDRSDRAVAVEPIDADHLMLRFGDGVHGRRPATDLRYTAHARINRGAQGNIGPQSLAHIVGNDDRIVAVTNPTAAVGGRDPEPIAAARAAAPVANFGQRRCVTEQDYRGAVLALPGVCAARVRRHHTGPRDRVDIVIALSGGRTVTDRIARAVIARITPLALIADELTVIGAIPCHPRIALTLTPAKAASRAAIRDMVAARLVALELDIGVPLAADRVAALAASVPGVAGVMDVTVEGGDDLAAPGDTILVIDRDHLTITLTDSAA